MECGITPIVDLCDTDPSECKLSQICGKATTDNAGQISWDDSAVGHVALAKEYGLQCDVVVEDAAVNDGCSTESADNCTAEELCNRSVHFVNGERAWDTSSLVWQAHVAEAKKRGLSCGVEIKATNFKKAFTSQSRLKRQQLQYALKKLGYYSYGVDGLWGKGTSAAFDKFLNGSGYGLKGKRESEVFSSLLYRVNAPSSFAAPKKKVAAPKQNSGGLTAIISNPSTTGKQALAICRPQAQLAESQARSSANSGRSNRRKTYDVDCSFGSCIATDMTPTGGAWGGVLKALTKERAGNNAYNTAISTCIAQQGWTK